MSERRHCAGVSSFSDSEVVHRQKLNLHRHSCCREVNISKCTTLVDVNELVHLTRTQKNEEPRRQSFTVQSPVKASAPGWKITGNC